MKAIILATMMVIGATAGASYTKTSSVCYGGNSTDPKQCRTMTYTYFDARNQTNCSQEGNGTKERCYTSNVTGNWTASANPKDSRVGEGGKGKN